jgi:hypothetical protein
MAKIVRIKNTGADAIWVGQTLAQDVYFTIEEIQRLRWADDSQVRADVIAGTLVVNDGTSDFADTAKGWNWLRSYSDNQITSSSTETTTTSTPWVDMAGMTLTTSNSNGLDYFIGFKCNVSNTVKNNDVCIRLMVNGAAVDHSVRQTTVAGNNHEYEMSTQDAQVIGNGIIIKVQWCVTAGTGKCTNRSLLLQAY